MFQRGFFFVCNCGQRKTDLVLLEIKAKLGSTNRKGHLKVTKVVRRLFCYDRFIINLQTAIFILKENYAF
jgi:hypothetical protein